MRMTGMVEVAVIDEHFGNKTVKLSILQQIKLKLLGRVYLFHAAKEGWRAELPFYIIKCDRHNIYFIDYPHGLDGHFHCLKCSDEGKQNGNGLSLRESGHV